MKSRKYIPVVLLYGLMTRPVFAIEPVYDGAEGLGATVFATDCLACHASDLTGVARNGAPPSVNFDTFEAAASNGPRAIVRAVEQMSMPPSGPLTDEQKAALSAWEQAGFPRAVAAPDPVTVGGSVSGLAAGNSLVLQNNASDNLTVTADDTISFPTTLSDGSPYNVTVLTQPADQTCTVSNGSGTATAGTPVSVSITCVMNAPTPDPTPNPTPAGNVAPIPTLSETGFLILMLSLISLVAWKRHRFSARP